MSSDLCGEFLKFLLDKARNGYKGVIYDCLKKQEIYKFQDLNPIKNFGSFYTASKKTTRIDPADAAKVEADIMQYLQKIKAKNYTDEGFNRLIIILSELYDNNFPSASEVFERAKEHRHAVKVAQSPEIDKVEQELKRAIDLYHSEYVGFFLWHLGQKSSDRKTDEQAKAELGALKRLAASYTRLLAKYLDFVRIINLKYYPNLFTLSEADLSKVTLDSIFGSVRNIAKFCSGKFDRETISAKLIANKNKPLNNESINKDHTEDRNRGKYYFSKNGVVLPKDFCDGISNHNKRALLSSIANQSLLIFTETLKNNFVSFGYGFGLSNAAEFEVEIDISNENLYRVRAQSRTVKYQKWNNEENVTNVDNPPIFYMNISFDIKCDIQDDHDVFEVIPSSEKCNLMFVGNANQDYQFKVRGQTVNPSSVPRPHIDFVQQYFRDFIIYIIGKEDYEKSEDDFASYSLMDFYNSVYAFGFKNNYANDAPVISSFINRHATVGEIDYAAEGFILFDFASTRLQQAISDDAKERYKSLMRFAINIIMLSWQKVNTLADALYEFRRVSQLIINSDLIKNEVFIQKYLAFGGRLLKQMYALPLNNSKRSMYLFNFENAFEPVAEKLSLTTTLGGWKKADLVLAGHMQRAVENPQNKRELCELLSSVVSAPASPAVRMLKEVLQLQDFETSRSLKQHPGTILTSQILSSRKIINDPKITGKVVVELLKPHPELAREIVQPSFWQSLFGTNVSARFDKENIKQLIKDHCADVAGIFARPRRLFGRSLMNQLTGQDIVEIFLDSIFNHRSELLQALPRNKNIAKKLIRLGSSELKRKSYLALITYDYHQAEKLLFTYPELETDFHKLVPEYQTAQTVIKAFQKNSLDLNDYFDPQNPEKSRQVANIILARCCSDTPLRNKVFKNEALLEKLYEYVDPLILELRLVKPEINIEEIKKLSDEIKNLLANPNLKLLEYLKDKLNVLEKNLHDCHLRNIFLSNLKYRHAELKGKTDFVSKFLFAKADAYYDKYAFYCVRLEQSKEAVRVLRENMSGFKDKLEALKNTDVPIADREELSVYDDLVASPSRPIAVIS